MRRIKKQRIRRYEYNVIIKHMIWYKRSEWVDYYFVQNLHSTSNEWLNNILEILEKYITHVQCVILRYSH